MKRAGKIVSGIVFFCSFVWQMQAQSVLKDGEIPKDLIITLSLSSTVQFSDAYIYKINPDRTVFFENRSNSLPLGVSFAGLLSGKVGETSKPVKIKSPELKDKLSKKQIKQILIEFEKSGFFEMNEYYQGDPTLELNTCHTHADTKSLSISANGKTKKVGFYLGCSYGEKAPLKSFLTLFDKISEILKSVKKETR